MSFLGARSPTPDPRRSKTIAPPHTHFNLDAPLAVEQIVLAPGDKYVSVLGVTPSSRVNRLGAILVSKASPATPHASENERNTSPRAWVYSCFVSHCDLGFGGWTISSLFFDALEFFSSTLLLPFGPGISPTFLNNVAKKPPMSWSCGTNLKHHSNGGPLMRFPSFVTPDAVGAHIEGLKAFFSPSLRFLFLEESSEEDCVSS